MRLLPSSLMSHCVSTIPLFIHTVTKSAGNSARHESDIVLRRDNKKPGAENFYEGRGGWDCLDGGGIPRRACAAGTRSSLGARARPPEGRGDVYALASLFFRHGAAECPWTRDYPNMIENWL